MTVLSQRIIDLKMRVKRAANTLRLDDIRARAAGLEVQTGVPDFWSDQKHAAEVSRELADMRKQIADWEDMETRVADLQDLEGVASKEEDIIVLADLARLTDELCTRFETMELQTLLTGEFDENNAIVSIHAGAGGADAMDWAGMLARMLIRYVQGREWIIEILEESLAEEGGYKSMTFSVRGRFAYGYLQSEAGVHRLVRISPFDAEKMRHTSFALVEVIPELNDVSEAQIEINPDDLRIDTFMSSGKGGQSVNTTYSAIRITHTPTNTVVTCQNERSQLQNKDTAMRVLKSKLFRRMLDERTEKISEIRGGHKSPEWGNQIRSYVIHPYKLVKDHRTQEETQDVDRVLDGNLDAFVFAYLRHKAQK